VSEERRVLIAREAGIHIASAADITDAVGACLGAYGALVVGEEDLAPALFDLRTGLAGELFQKPQPNEPRRREGREGNRQGVPNRYVASSPPPWRFGAPWRFVFVFFAPSRFLLLHLLTERHWV
jgi:hypothetical protein